MFEDFRKQAEEADFPEEDYDETQQTDGSHKRQGYFLGLTPIQRFIIAFMLLCMITLLGTLILMVTQKIVFPFYY